MREHPFFVFVEGVVHHQGRYLMIRRGESTTYLPGKIAFPAGKLEREEVPTTLERAVQREILEETGVSVGTPQYLESECFLSGDGRFAVSVKFLCAYAGGEPVPQPGEVAEVLWLTLQQVQAHPDAPEWTRATLERAAVVLSP